MVIYNATNRLVKTAGFLTWGGTVVNPLWKASAEMLWGVGVGIAIDVISNWSSLFCRGVISDHPWPWLPPHSAVPCKSSWSSSPQLIHALFDVHPALFRVCPHFCFTAIPNVERNREMTIVSHWKVHVSQAPSFLSFQLKEKRKPLTMGCFSLRN